MPRAKNMAPCTTEAADRTVSQSCPIPKQHEPIFPTLNPKPLNPMIPTGRSLSDMQTNAQCLGGVPVPAEVLSSLLEDWMGWVWGFRV